MIIRDNRVKINTESRWQRPTLYLTIINIYFLILSSIEVSLASYVIYILMKARETIPNLIGFGDVIFLLFVTLVTSIVLITPSIMGVNLLLQKKKKGTIISLAALTFWTISLSVLSIGMTNQEIFRHQSVAYATVISLLGSNAVMYIFLIISRKLVQWKNDTLDELLKPSRNRSIQFNQTLKKLHFF